MNPTFWKLSMGPGSTKDDFSSFFTVLDWVRRGVVLVHKDTKAKGISLKSQGQEFIEKDREGDYFYLCHGNESPSIVLLGQFVGPVNYLCKRGEGWVERPFRWIETSKLKKRFSGTEKWWTPNHNSTFVSVPDKELNEFEKEILTPYFGFALRDFGIHISP